MIIPNNKCGIEECQRDAVSSGYCDLHWQREIRGYDPKSEEAKHGKPKDSIIHFNRPEYNSWRSMKARCLNPNYRYYKRYGGRGITVCDKWLGKDGFYNFLNDMGCKPSFKFTLDRIDNDGIYSPENCRWATQKEQIRNSTITTRIDIGNGEELLIDVLKKNNIKSATYYNRIYNQGWDKLTAATKKVRG